MVGIHPFRGMPGDREGCCRPLYGRGPEPERGQAATARAGIKDKRTWEPGQRGLWHGGLGYKRLHCVLGHHDQPKNIPGSAMEDAGIMKRPSFFAAQPSSSGPYDLVIPGQQGKGEGRSSAGKTSPMTLCHVDTEMDFDFRPHIYTCISQLPSHANVEIKIHDCHVGRTMRLCCHQHRPCILVTSSHATNHVSFSPSQRIPAS